MTLEGTYDSKLLRIIIGFLHVSLLQQIALTRHGKPFESLAPEEKAKIQGEMVNAVMEVARQVGEEAIEAFLKPPPPPPPPGKVN